MPITFFRNLIDWLTEDHSEVDCGCCINNDLVEAVCMTDIHSVHEDQAKDSGYRGVIDH